MFLKFKSYFYLFVTFILATSFSDKGNATYKNELPDLEKLASLEWVQTKIKEYPELEWLLAKDVHQTQEGKSTNSEHSWSQKIKGYHYPEFERTILSIFCLDLIADGSDEAYERFTMLQPSVEKLTPESFKRLHEFADSVLNKEPHLLQAEEINLLLGDLGKTETARKKAKEYGITEPDHDRFLAACLVKCPHIFPTFQKLAPEIQSKIKKMAGLIHFGHLWHVEGDPSMLSDLKKSGVLTNDPSGFDFEILTHICDVSAARGHEDNRGSKVLTESTFKTLEMVKDALKYLSTHSEVEALKFYLSARAENLGLESKDPEQMFVVARLGAMTRLYGKEEGAALQEGYKSLQPEQRELIIRELNPLVSRHEMTPTYIPAVLINLISVYKQQGLPKDRAIQRCVQEGVSFIANVLYQYRNEKTNRSYDPHLTLNFNKVAGQVRDRPDLLKNPAVTIDENGHVEIDVTSS